MHRILWPLLTAALAFGQSPALKVSGKITGPAGEPLRKAEVTLTRMPSGGGGGSRGGPVVYVSTSAADGAFVFDAVPPGEYYLSATRNGYVLPPEMQMRGSEAITVAAGTKLDGFVFHLSPQAVITGRVVDSDGDPLPGIDVGLSREMTVQGRQQRIPSGPHALSNDLGEFRLAGVAPGTYYLFANGPRGMGQDRRIRSGGDEILATTYYPNTTDEAAAKALELSAGTEMRGIELHLTQVRAYRVRGRVTLPAEADSRALMVNLMPAPKGGSGVMGAFGGGMMSRGDSSFDIGGVAPGSYILMASYNENGHQRSARMLVEVSDHNVDGLTVTFASGVNLAGSVTAVGALAFRPDTVQISLAPAETDTLMAFPSSASPARGGAFTIENVPKGLYWVHAYVNPEDGYVQSVRYGGHDANESPIQVTENAPAGTIEVVIATDGGEVSGVVQDDQGKPVASALVRAVLAKAAYQERPNGGITDQNGRFRIRGVPPGNYRVYAVSGPDCCGVASADFLQRNSDKMANAVVAPKGTATVTLRVIAAK